MVVNGYSERWLRQGFPWVYPAEVVGPPPGPPGAVVTLQAANGDGLGAGIADQGWIAVRRFRADAGPVDRALLAARLDAALALRAGLVPPETDAWRAVHGENDGLPGVRVDVWARTVVITLDSPSLAGLVDDLADLVVERLGAEAVWVGYRPDPRDERAHWPPPPGCVRGAPARGPIEVRERGVRFLVDIDARKDVGLFPDVRELRAWLDPHWRGATVLNLFAHTGAFSVFAARGGAAAVHTVDLSGPWLQRARENLRLNGLPEGEIVEDDAFRALDRYRRAGQRFDRVIVDPPGFAHSKAGGWSTEQDYPRLVAAALRVLAPGGWLVACSNVGSLSPRQFQGLLIEGARRSGHALVGLHEAGAAPDFPCALDFPEARYLKAAVLAAFPR